MEYEEKKMGKFNIMSYKTEKQTVVTVLFEGYLCEEFEGAVTGVQYKQGLLIKPEKGKEDRNNRTYYFFNNNGDEVFRTKRKMNADETEFLETIHVYDDCDSVTYQKTSIDGDVVTKSFNIATNQEVVEGQISLF